MPIGASTCSASGQLLHDERLGAGSATHGNATEITDTGDA